MLASSIQCNKSLTCLCRKSNQRLRTALTATYAVNVVLAYLLMLAVMTYNVGCTVAVVAGIAVGYYAFMSAQMDGSAARAPADLCCP